MAGVLDVAEPKSVRQRLADVGEANGLEPVECPSDEIPVAAQYLGEAAEAAPSSAARGGGRRRRPLARGKREGGACVGEEEQRATAVLEMVTRRDIGDVFSNVSVDLCNRRTIIVAKVTLIVTNINAGFRFSKVAGLFFGG